MVNNRNNGSSKIRRAAGGILLLVVGTFVGYLFAYNKDVVDRFGGLGNLVAGVIFVGLVILAIFWPKEWHASKKKEWLRRLVFTSALVTAFIGREFILGAFTDAPLAFLLWLGGLIVVISLGLALILMDRAPQWYTEYRDDREDRKDRKANRQSRSYDPDDED